MATKSELLNFLRKTVAQVEGLSVKRSARMETWSDGVGTFLGELKQEAGKLLASEDEVRLAWAKLVAGHYVTDVIGLHFDLQRAWRGNGQWTVACNGVVLHGVSAGLSLAQAKAKAVAHARAVALSTRSASAPTEGK